jgi:hypothetical protein
MRILTLLVIFIIGLAAGLLLASAKPDQWQDGDYDGGLQQVTAPFQPVRAQENPMDRVPEKAIEVYQDRIILDIQDAQWATFTDTHSMEPVLFKGANALEIVPKSPDDVKVGDIVSYKSEYAEGSIIHRVVYKGEDEQGTYFIMKGDNLPTSDPGRARFNQIQRVVIAIVY